MYNFCVRAISKYLEFFLSPVAPAHSWEAPVAKWKARTSAFAKAGASPNVSAFLYNTRSRPVLSYVSQFMWPSKSILDSSNYHANLVYHTAPNTIIGSSYEQLLPFGAVPIGKAANLCRAAIIRAATETFEWSTPRTKLRAAADVGTFPVLRLIQDRPLPSFWSSEPFCWTLGRAVEGSPGIGKPIVVTATIDAAATAKTSPKPQIVAYKSLHFSLSGGSVHDFLRLRLLKLFPDHSIAINAVAWGSAPTVLKRAKSKTAHAIIKSWCGGWTTSRRLHETLIRSCYAGCDIPGSDCWTHYACCQRWRGLVHGGRSPRFTQGIAISLDPTDLAEIAISFDVYHSLKGSCARQLLGALDSRSVLPTTVFHDRIRRIFQPVGYAAGRRLAIRTTTQSRSGGVSRFRVADTLQAVFVSDASP